jgi:hypothetical protein
MIQNVMGVLFQALEIIFEMQKKRSNEKIRKKKKLFNLQNTFFLFFFLWTPFTFLKFLHLK